MLEERIRRVPKDQSMTTSEINTLDGSRCLVTGGAGFIGSHIVDMLLREGAKVRVLDNFSTGYRHHLDQQGDGHCVEVIEGDVSSREVAGTAMNDVQYVFHLAAMASVPRSMREPDLCHAWCATSTVHLLHAAAEANVRRFVLASTSAAYGNSPYVSKREVDPVAPLSPYAAAKLSAEAYCHAFFEGFGMETVVLRYFNVFGPRQDPKSEYSAVIPRFVSMILSGDRPIIYGDGHQSRDFVFVKDVAMANRLAATVAEAAGGTFNIGRGQSTTLLQLLTTLQEILGQDIVPIHEAARAGDVRDSLADITEARRRLRFEPEVSVTEGLRQSVDYYRSLVESTSPA
jgi:UDP-glucose 4-epimerase